MMRKDQEAGMDEHIEPNEGAEVARRLAKQWLAEGSELIPDPASVDRPRRTPSTVRSRSCSSAASRSSTTTWVGGAFAARCSVICCVSSVGSWLDANPSAADAAIRQRLLSVGTSQERLEFLG